MTAPHVAWDGSPVDVYRALSSMGVDRWLARERGWSPAVDTFETNGAHSAS